MFQDLSRRSIQGRIQGGGGDIRPPLTDSGKA